MLTLLPICSSLEFPDMYMERLVRELVNSF